MLKSKPSQKAGLFPSLLQPPHTLGRSAAGFLRGRESLWSLGCEGRGDRPCSAPPERAHWVVAQRLLALWPMSALSCAPSPGWVSSSWSQSAVCPCPANSTVACEHEGLATATWASPPWAAPIECPEPPTSQPGWVPLPWEQESGLGLGPRCRRACACRSLSVSSVSSVSSATSSSSSAHSVDSDDMYADLASPVSSASSRSPTPAQTKKEKGRACVQGRGRAAAPCCQ